MSAVSPRTICASSMKAKRLPYSRLKASCGSSESRPSTGVDPVFLSGRLFRNLLGIGSPAVVYLIASPAYTLRAGRLGFCRSAAHRSRWLPRLKSQMSRLLRRDSDSESRFNSRHDYSDLGTCHPCSLLRREQKQDAPGCAFNAFTTTLRRALPSWVFARRWMVSFIALTKSSFVTLAL